MYDKKKSVLVTGATNGTGYAIAKRFAREGYDVFITSRHGDSAQEAAKKLEGELAGTKVFGLELPVAGEDVVISVFDKIRALGYLLDTVVLNAANLGIGQSPLTVSVKDFSEVINTNIIWNFTIARTAALMMKEKGMGAIVFINSNTAYRAIPDRCGYSASKAGVLGLSRALALDLGKYGIRSNAVLPGMIKTERFSENINNIQHAMSAYTPIGDVAEFDDIANAAYFLGSDQSRNVTGTELVVDGGNMCQLYPILPHGYTVD